MSQAPLSISSFVGLSSGPPPGFPPNGNGLWYNNIGTEWAYDYLPVGNGYLAVMSPGGTTQEISFLNIESLWSGGPFADSAYNGGNKQPDEREAMAEAMQSIRQTIFSTDGTVPNINVLTTPADNYGTF